MTEKIKDIPDEFIPESVQPLLDAIAEHLIQRGVHVGYLQNKDYPIHLHECSFWLNYNEETSTIRLGLSQNPLTWDLEQIRIALLEDEHLFMEEKGARFSQSTSF